jgi:hypothetical protein
MFAYLALQWSPIQYYLYVGFAIYYWTNILKQVDDTRRILNKIGLSGFKTALYFIVFVAALEIFVSHSGNSIIDIYDWCNCDGGVFADLSCRCWVLSIVQSTRLFLQF